jgi:hypothetical protein
VVIPEDISRNGVAAHRFGHLYAVTPIFDRYSGWMNFSGDHLERFSVEQEFGFFEFKRMCFNLAKQANIQKSNKKDEN